MTNSLIPANLAIPAHLQGRIGAPSVLAQAIVGGIGGAGFPRISIKGSRFRIVEGDTETVLDSLSLDVVIVGANPRLSKIYYIKQWTPDAEPQQPDCQSLDGVAPDPASPAIQNDLCATCPQNAWGSRVNPQTGVEQKACADQKRLAVIAADDPGGPVYLLQVTPAALKGLNQYHKELQVRGIPPEFIKTRVSFDTSASFPKLAFGFGGFLDMEVQEQVDKLFGSPEVLEVTGESYQSAQKPVLAPTAGPPKLAVVAVAAPKPVVAAPEPPAAAVPVTEPPAAKRGFGAAKGVAKLKTATRQNTVTPAAAPPVKPVVQATGAALSLQDEIAALVGEVSADDA